ncbi:CocE/NonD family hydrolase [Mariniblastus fucicola]|nr:CocE/NonD family hydrolase [Mariniblastus fucicola]
MNTGNKSMCILTRFVFLVAFALATSFAGHASAQQFPGAERIIAAYQKTEVDIPMRDGIKLHTTIYSPRDTSKKYPIMLNRTPYSTGPYGEGRYSPRVGPSAIMEDQGYIFVHQDVRGRFMSEGSYDNMRPNVDDEKVVDESSDTYDTIDFLVKRVRNNNGKVGMWGISYPGFYCAAALPNHHPALVASTPQAPISDFFFDDFHHHGAYLLSYLSATNTFGYQHNGPTQRKWYPEVAMGTKDAWQFYLNMGSLKNADQLFEEKNEFWQQLSNHPNYDSFWQKRSILPHLKDIKTNVLVVGGFYDAEDLYGPLNIYRSIEKNNDTFNAIIMGPWEHGEWARRGVRPDQIYTVGKLGIDKGLQEFYQRQVEAPFFAHFLKGEGAAPEFEAMMYDTGARSWKKFSKWPPAESKTIKQYFGAGGKLGSEAPQSNANADDAFTEFISDPANPVPYRQQSDIKFRFTPREFMTDDQRFATARPDVLSFVSDPLEKPMTLTGDMLAHLQVSTSQSAADWIVKLIDVYPDDHPFVEGSDAGIKFGGFQGLVRSETIRGRFRNSYEKPEPFVPDEVATVDLPLQDVCYTFKPGHRIMIHVQSTFFPYIDRNPQKYVPNIFDADDADFVPATHRVYHNADNASWIEMKVLE